MELVKNQLFDDILIIWPAPYIYIYIYIYVILLKLQKWFSQEQWEIF